MFSIYKQSKMNLEYTTNKDEADIYSQNGI